jgi:aryl-alcohol dehydrogenase-like predicted oxidoreductase
MVPFCLKNGIKLLAYGTLGGGLFSSKFYKKEEPDYNQLKTSSLQKYYGMIRRWGSWDKFQVLLSVLKNISEKYGVSIANVAVRYVLEQPSVAGTIIGARLSLSNHIDESLKVFSFSLNQNDHQKIQSAYKTGNDLFEKIGDCGAEYR